MPVWRLAIGCCYTAQSLILALASKTAGVVVMATPLRRAGEFSTVIDRAQATHAICEAALSTELEVATRCVQWRGDVRVYTTDDGYLCDHWLRDYLTVFAAARTQANPKHILFTETLLPRKYSPTTGPAITRPVGRVVPRFLHLKSMMLFHRAE
ncbi:hypothetical protein WL37_10355 [Burkholderia ubonensis]|nr:hypothetical protein WJ87_09550 [Burkholderia ubonensis]KWB50392.1 hypothetical protein WL37_10355 [Burkholderia ubonensis]